MKDWVGLQPRFKMHNFPHVKRALYSTATSELHLHGKKDVEIL